MWYHFLLLVRAREEHLGVSYTSLARTVEGIHGAAQMEELVVSTERRFPIRTSCVARL